MNRLATKKNLPLITLLLLTICYFGFINPRGGRSIVLFLGFLILGLDMYVLTRFLVRLTGLMTGKKYLGSRRFSVTVTIAALIMLALQSIGQLSLWDALAIVVVVMVFLFYTSYYRFGRR